MSFHFHIRKAMQAIGVLLRFERSRRMNSMRLLKLLYIADRESLRETGRPITGGHVVAMKRGPVLSGVYDLIRGQHLETPHWEQFVRKDRYEIELIGEVGVGELSRYEIGKLEEISKRYADCDEWDMVWLTHEFPEWRRNDPGNASRPIPLEHILEAVGRIDDMASIVQDEKDRMAFERVFGE